MSLLKLQNLLNRFATSATLVKSLIAACALVLFTLYCTPTQAQTGTGAGNLFPVKVNIGFDEADSPKDFVLTLQIVVMLTILTMAPSIMLMMTSFTRIIIIFGFLRKAIGTQSEPPNQIIVGLAMFLTFFLMAPVLNEIKDTALVPYIDGEITQKEGLMKAGETMRQFMLSHTREQELGFFMKIANLPQPKTPSDVPLLTVIPAFMISELKTAFQIGFVLYLPFLLIDMVIASLLMSMGMMMLPPVMISMPFKILLFVLVDGWYLITKSIVTSY